MDARGRAAEAALSVAEGLPDRRSHRAAVLLARAGLALGDLTAATLLDPAAIERARRRPGGRAGRRLAGQGPVPAGRRGPRPGGDRAAPRGPAGPARVVATPLP